MSKPELVGRITINTQLDAVAATAFRNECEKHLLSQAQVLQRLIVWFSLLYHEAKQLVLGTLAPNRIQAVYKDLAEKANPQHQGTQTVNP
jgi:hypothetical protein